MTIKHIKNTHMKFFKYLISASVVLLLVSCSKKLEVESPTLEVITASTTIEAGSAIKFNIGDVNPPDNLYFYSGEATREYGNSYGVGAGRIAINKSGYEFSFQSRFDYNSPPADSATKYGLQTGQFSILASTDYSGTLDSASVKKATWTDITSRFTLPTVQHATTFTNSGVNSLDDIVVKGKRLYFALKVLTQRQRDFGYSRYWNIQNFSIKAKDSISGQLPVLYNTGKMEFNFVDISKAVRPSTVSRTATIVRMGGPNPYITRTEIEDSIINATGLVVDPALSEVWAVSAGVNVDTVFLGYDTPVTVASYTNVKFPTEYSHVYSKPGTYKAVFVGENRTKDETKRVLKEFTIIVNPKP